ncbi:3-hexulose-6-phosphate synthase [Secundilactobacillus oryzae JCM 18671]|uniref:3-hexulose-6-phosphate synthase n=1 Tax=Secundilactobacillus oryzae JCM 18671 TaxID=1291743 RepID=A0A081BKP1_9LACO|nr:orotidine 5'-phosphate decarboxylase / HUMPS family protein [Secundilactobacillus oryzae]GAK48609.1 3-hexulose-6-phosphate synthase [Secundilactobacillus oryzae JCM 18671]
MKLQVAIDRVSLEYAAETAAKLDGIVDIVEFGTSLVKDYGLLNMTQTVKSLKHAQALIDIKTIDEGEYEFRKGYESGANILTVMGGSSVDTIKKVSQVAQEAGQEIFIDLMETDNQKMAEIANIPDAIYGIHHSKDNVSGFDAVATVEQFHKDFPDIKRISVAGGINLDTASRLAKQGIVESVIVGGGILKAEDPVKAAKTFMEAIG